MHADEQGSPTGNMSTDNTQHLVIMGVTKKDALTELLVEDFVKRHLPNLSEVLVHYAPHTERD